MASQAKESSYPPPPPSPPPPENLKSKISPYVLKLRNAPSDYFYQAPKNSPFVDLLAAPTGPYFFYGTLVDPSMLAEVLGLDEKPKLRPAYLLGYDCKMWGQYPALIDAPGSVVHGFVYHVRTVEFGEKLATYETNNYHAEPCLIRFTDDQGPKEDIGHTFKFVGNVNDLSDGNFSLELWLRRMGRQIETDKVDSTSGSQ
ncbi:hypothetical protein BO86DRAFT_307084 [Aspergillus japonicus CBS 114.51]|uniref:Putative gamma-glutamylcyclotransferase n=1 Tax=Aspergillus japonicus CBS 114.51 TaxID=1448312 RepID=A0A8T8X927_ASPJA|nr:hypothetical protein BO86DRAFT_307084 [Aspergillus japonicus CBS 114.51]RAH84384.1 hypothetical protein BO86DRAFT_307084 [Aspergillus japonicus CBS 114.51]